MKLIPKYNKGDKVITGTTVTNHYGDKTHYLPVSKSKEKDIDYNVGLPEITITPKNNLDLASAVNRGKEKFLKTAGEIATPIVMGAGLGALGAGLVTAPLMTLGTTGLSIGGGYIGGKIGEQVDKKSTNKDSNYKAIGQLLGGSIAGLGTIATPKLIAGDAYTTVGGKFGYYGNPLERVTGTLGRRFNWNTKAKSPELMRRIKGPVKINKDNSIQVSNPTPREDFNRTNFTTDRPVVPHKKGNWDGTDLYVFDPKITKGLKPKSIEPSDTFFADVNITAKPSQTTLVSGNKFALADAKSKGMSTLSSSKARNLYQKAQHDYTAALGKWKKDFANARGANRKFVEQSKPELDHFSDKYALEIQRLQTKRGTPTLKDYKQLERESGLKAGVTDKPILPELEKYMKATEKAFDMGDYDIMINNPFKYPNGRKPDPTKFIEELNLLRKRPYNKVQYDPASEVEINYKYGNKSWKQ